MASAFGFPRVFCHEEALESVEGLRVLGVVAPDGQQQLFPRLL